VSGVASVDPARCWRVCSLKAKRPACDAALVLRKRPRASRGLGGGGRGARSGWGAGIKRAFISTGLEAPCSDRNDSGANLVLPRTGGRYAAAAPEAGHGSQGFSAERAFQIAEAGHVGRVDDIKKRLMLEGYDYRVVNGGPSLISQLRERIRAARRRDAPDPRTP
jgi:hypothetical protein